MKTRIVHFLIALISTFSIFAKDVKIKNPIGVLPIGKSLSKFYRLEIMKISVGILMKSQKYSLFLNASESEVTENIVEFIQFDFKEKGQFFDLTLNLLTNSQVKRDVRLNSINKNNVLFYVRLGIYELLYGKSYLKKNYQKILDEHKESYSQVQNRLKIENQNRGLEISLFNNSSPRKRRSNRSQLSKSYVNKNQKTKKHPSHEGQFSAPSLSIKSSKNQSQNKKNTNRERIDKNFKKKTAKIALNDKKSLRLRKNKTQASKAALKNKVTSTESNQNHTSSFNTNQKTLGGSSNFENTDNEVREYVKKYKRKGIMGIGLNVKQVSKDTQDLVSVDYSISYLSASFLYELPNPYTPRDSFWFEVNYLYPSENVLVKSGDIQSEVKLDSLYTLSGNYQMFVKNSKFSFLSGLHLDKTQFVNLPQINGGFSLGKASGVFVYGGIQYSDNIFDRDFNVKVYGKKMFFGTLEYNTGSEVTIDSLEFGVFSSIEVFKDYYLTSEFIYSTYTSRTRSSLSDEASVLSFGLTYLL